LDSAMRLRRLIEDMINLRDIDAGEARLELKRVNVQDLVATAVEEIQSFAEAKEQRVLISFTDKEPIVVQVDRNKIAIVLVNLLSNASKFTDHGGKIGIRVSRRGGGACFTVWDTGVGIPSKELDHIFDRFYQVESSLVRHYEGMGLGLAIVKEMVDLHHGHIKVESREGRGSAFTVTIPIHQPA